MDRLRSPGGCPWDAAQSHESLTRYLVEECYEVIEAIETGDRALLREELGDLLLQVLFHARLAEELPEGEGFGIDEVASDLADKLVHRHPHVFGPDRGVAELDAAALENTWESAKVREKGRTSAVDGVPLGQPSLALAAKLVSRARRANIEAAIELTATATEIAAAEASAIEDAAERVVGRRLFELVQSAVAAGVDPEGALRAAALEYREAVLEAENRGRAHPERKDPPGSTGGTTGRVTEL